jgi:penicillin-binding protein-related factor A (putative recombinase)
MKTQSPEAPTEKQIEKTILTWLNYQPEVFAFKVNTTGIYDPVRKVFRTIKNPFIHAGTADIIGLRAGIFFAIEVKTVKNMKRVSDVQVRFLNRVRLSKGYAIVATSLADVITLINRMQEIEGNP